MIANSSRRRRALFCRGNRKKGARGRKEEAGRKFPTRGRKQIAQTGGGDARTQLARIFARVGPRMGNLANFAKPYAKPLESRFQGFWQNFRMKSADAKLLEML